MEITFRQLQRLNVNELQNYIQDGDAVVTVNAQPKFVVSNYPRCKEGIGCSLTNALVAPHIDSQAGMLVSPPNSPDKRYHPTTLATKDVILAKLDEVLAETKEQRQIVDKLWPLPRRAIPKVDRSEQFTPTLELEQVKMMIDAAKDGTLKETSHGKADLLEKYAANLPDDRYRAHYVSYARNFLDYADALDKENINKYLARLKRQGKSPGTINFAYRVIRTLFNVNKLDWPFRRDEAPQIRQRDEYKPALAPELIRIMVEAAKNGRLDTAPACFLSLSTIFALRREELCDLEPGDVDIKADTIFVSTVKFGRERYHLIPMEIKPYLEAHDFSKRYSLTQMSQLFWVVVNRSGLEALRPKRLGWHCIRHTVKTLLDNSGLSPFAVHDFMRWKGAERQFAMDVRYHASHFVGLEGTTMVTEEAESDKEIFEKHSLLEFWR
ncbi:hypothetical protein ES703_41245 [subsurface metagenome]